MGAIALVRARALHRRRRVRHDASRRSAACSAGFLYGAIPGALRAYRGAHEVITTIMLNFVAIQVGRYLVGIGGPLQKPNSGTPFSDKLPASLRWPQFWGEFETNQVHLGIFFALAAVFVYWLILERTTLGYEVKAVGNNPEAARYGGVYVQRAVVLSMGIAGAFAGPRRLGRDARPLLPAAGEHALGRARQPRLHRHRGGAARPEYADRDHPRRAAVLRPRLRRASALGRDPGRARARAGDDHPGRRDPVRRRRGASCTGCSGRGRRRSVRSTPARRRSSRPRRPPPGSRCERPVRRHHGTLRRAHVRAEAARPGRHGGGRHWPSCSSSRRS